MTDPAPTPHVRIETDGTHGFIEVDGQNISEHVQAFSLDWNIGVGPIPTLTIETNPVSTLYDGPAIVQVAVPVASGDAVRRLDPMAVGDAVSAAGIDMGGNLYATVLEVVAQMVDALGLDDQDAEP